MQASNNCTFSCKSGVAEGGGGRRGLLRWTLLNHNNNRSICGWNTQFRSWCGVHCMCKGFFFFYYCKASYSQHTYRLHTPCTEGSYSKSRGLICMIYMLHLRSPASAPLPKPHMWQRIQLPPTRHPPHPTHVSYHDHDIPGIPQKREIRRVPRNLSQERGRVQTDSAACRITPRTWKMSSHWAVERELEIWAESFDPRRYTSSGKSSATVFQQRADGGGGGW